MSRFSRKALRAAFVAALVLAAVAVVSPVASAAKRRTLMPVTCQPVAAHWISVNDDLGVPWLQFVPATRCSDADASACPSGTLDQSWVGIMDDLGLWWLAPTGPANADGSCRSTAGSAPQPGVAMQSPYRGWVVVTDAQGTPKLVPLSDIR